MEQPIGTCSLCGGTVVAWQGGWWSINPPPAPHCLNCGAVQAGSVIQMQPRAPRTYRTYGAEELPLEWWEQLNG